MQMSMELKKSSEEAKKKQNKKDWERNDFYSQIGV
jgi:hypothetical protein